MRMKLRVLSMLTLLTCLHLNNAFSQVAQAQQDMNLVRYLNPVFQSVDVQRDIEFGEVINFKGDQEKLLLDVYTASGDKETGRPAILWIHGGGFRIGKNDKSQSYIVDMSNRFARRGYVCVSINYRVRNDPMSDKTGTMTDALEDAMSGLNWLRENAEMLNVDKDHVVIGGGSAGGMIAVNLCYKDNTAKRQWDKSGIIALINLWGSPDQSIRMSIVDPIDPPTIIVHGTEDLSVPFENTEQLIHELRSSGVQCELVAIEGAGHTPRAHMDDFELNVSEFLYSILKESP